MITHTAIIDGIRLSVCAPDEKFCLASSPAWRIVATTPDHSRYMWQRGFPSQDAAVAYFKKEIQR